MTISERILEQVAIIRKAYDVTSKIGLDGPDVRFKWAAEELEKIAKELDG